MSRYRAADDRYEQIEYRQVGRSGLRLPGLSLGLWHNFGDTTSLDTQRAVVRRAFDLGITHFDLANNYGPPPGSAEENFGRLLATDLRPYRDELVISSKAGYDMWPGPYGDGGSRKYLLSSLDQSLGRLGLDYVDVFYSHRFDPETSSRGDDGRPAHRSHQRSRALRRASRTTSPSQTREAAAILADLGTPLVIHQPNYSMFSRHIENVREDETESLLDVVGDLGIGTIVFSPLQQGLLSDRYLSGDVPAGLARGGRALPQAVGAHVGLPDARAGAQRDRRGARADRSRSWRCRGCCATRA